MVVRRHEEDGVQVERDVADVEEVEVGHVGEQVAVEAVADVGPNVAFVDRLVSGVERRIEADDVVPEVEPQERGQSCQEQAYLDVGLLVAEGLLDRKSTRLNSSHT